MSIELVISFFGFILTTLGTILIINFKEMKSDVKNMSISIFDLNLKMERVLSDLVWHKDELNELKKRMTNLEKGERHES